MSLDDIFDTPPRPKTVSANVLLKGMAAYRVQNMAKDKGVREGVIMKELVIEGLKAKGLVGPKYSLSDMRQGF